MGWVYTIKIKGKNAITTSQLKRPRMALPVEPPGGLLWLPEVFVCVLKIQIFCGGFSSGQFGKLVWPN